MYQNKIFKTQWTKKVVNNKRVFMQFKMLKPHNPIAAWKASENRRALHLRAFLVLRACVFFLYPFIYKINKMPPESYQIASVSILLIN